MCKLVNFSSRWYQYQCQYQWDFEMIAGNVTKVFQFLDLLVKANCWFNSETEMTH